ncbi:MAG: IPTL-CTERM sorting domain-containing protein [Planctomycetota bacterium]
MSEHFECGYRPPQRWLEEVRTAVARGEISDPARRVIPPIRPGQPRTGSGIMPCLSPAHIFPFEDTNQILLTDFSTGQLIDLMVTAANDLMATHGDIYDFVGFWLNFAPHHVIGTAAYIGLENDVTGIGVQSAVGTELFNRRPDFGVGGQNIEGFLITWNINWPQWQPGTGPEAFMTRVALGHEIEHRFAMYLPDLLDGRQMQGYGGFGCYGPGHPNPAVDAQGSVLGIGEWVGSNPAVIQASYPDFYLFNSDTGGSYSYTELYLMGYVSPAEMDAGNSELRYMDDWNCVSGDYYGPISPFSSADIIAAAGPRVPDSTAEDRHYRTGWIMIHLPQDPPNVGQRAKAVAIHEQLQMDWTFSTLGRGTMDNSLFDDCNCNDVPDADDIAAGTSPDVNGNGIPDECEAMGIPTVSEWGVLVMTVLLLGSGVVVLRRCEPRAAATEVLEGGVPSAVGRRSSEAE